MDRAACGFEWEERGGLELYRARSLQAAGPVLAAVTSRRGGVSSGPYATLNLGLGVGDDPSCVRENRDRLARALGAPPSRIVSAPQVHGDGVAVVESGRLVPPGPADALITRDTGLFLAGYFADCVPVFLYDPDSGAVALAHAGWRGTVLKVAAAALGAMGARFGTRPGRVWAALGPAIGPCCYRVGEEVLQPLRRAFSGWEGLVGDGPPAGARGEDRGKDGGADPGSDQPRRPLDLVRANLACLEAAGVDPARISVAGLCTACHPERFFSHRRDGGRTGRMAALIGLLP
ncbi:MAG: peptidoglycan editing factor PgeF [Acetobacteraceae bacterium]|nr:peptidoglycan editing factor PgeF [Acetobacteraceae bacterium]